jgi:branched-chain amino acid transport system substrate-binding protein
MKLTRLAGLVGTLALLATRFVAAEPYEINVMIPLTGTAAFLGQGEQQTLGFAERLINNTGGIAGRPIKFLFEDDQSNPQLAVQLAGEIIAKKPAIMFGSSLVASCRAIAPLMKDGPVDYCFSPGIHPDKGRFVYTSSVSTTDTSDALLRFIRIKGWKRLAVMFSTDATGQDAENGIKELLARSDNKDIELVAVAHFNTTDVSVAAQMETLKAARPQCLIAWSTGTPIATIFRAMLDAGLELPTVTTSANMTYQQMAQYAGFLPKELYFSVAEWVVRDAALMSPAMAAKHAEFYRFFAEIGKKPDISSELAWDASMIATAALRARGDKASAAELHDFIAHLKDFPGVDGVYDFERVPQRGLDVSDSVVARWSPDSKSFDVVSKPGGSPLNP